VLQKEKAALQDQLLAQEKRIVELEERLAASLEREKPAAKKAAAERVGDLTFYSELPKQKVMPSPLGDTGPAAKQSKGAEVLEQRAAITRAGNRSIEKKAGGDASIALASYRLQVGSFIRRSDAEGLLNRMALAGVKAMVSEAQVAGVGTRYRVYTGPHVGLAAAEGAKALVYEKLKIKGLLLRE
jgi:cell division septation protein DedD